MTTYKKYTQLEHILARPDTYVGNLNPDVSKQWVYNGSQMQQKQCTFVSGLFKIFDELLVNALDQCVVDPTVDKIAVDINTEDNSISVMNSGKGVPIERHEYNNLWVPELIFGELLTSSNYNDNEQRVTGGRNGYGSKLVNVFSKRFCVEIVNENQKYVQEWTQNMTQKSKPKITKCAKKGYTKITFWPDLSRFGLKSLQDDDIVPLLERRALDACACSGPKVKVYLNGTNLGIKTFDKYVDTYIGSDKRVQEETDRWAVAVSQSENGFQQVSFVNGIHTSLGGTHVEYVMAQLVKRITEYLQGKHKDLQVKPQQIKEHMFLFVKCTLVNPTFSSQTKTECTSRWKDFGSVYKVSEDLVKKMVKMPFIEEIVSSAKHKTLRELNKTDGRKQSVIKGIPKLEDANKAGTAQSSKCTLILTEGDSAKTFAISGLGVIGRDYYGVFPLKGKLLNVRDASPKQLAGNEEITSIKQILGLQNGKVYKDTKELRYGHVMILTDADVDGSHIKGLFINFVHHFWPSLMELPDFLMSMRTPILKCTKGKQVQSFFSQQAYNEWKRTTDTKPWKIKYYKGLGTSSAAEAREYFKDLERCRVTYRYTADQSKDVELAFKKTLANERKEWISQVKEDPSDRLQQSVSEFIHRDLIWFSVSDNVRSIPNVMDGLKPSQRKVLYACRKRASNSEIKVSQLSGYVSTETSYHHGEQSLNMTIVNMAQDYVGSNNINLLLPKGQFGTRLMGGKDAASPRYIFTQLSESSFDLFRKEDDAVLKYLEDDGTPIEPEYFVPTLPMVLINGASGIGTGYSTSVPCYNPKDVAANVKRVLRGSEPLPMVPWYRGFTGTIEHVSDNKYVSRGNYKKTSGADTVEITELPIGLWTSDFKEYLDKLLVDNVIKAYENHSTETSVRFVVKGLPDDLLEKKLVTGLSTGNMHLFDSKGRIRLYETPEDIIREFVQTRLRFYELRKQHLIQVWTQTHEELSEKHRFIELVIHDTIQVFRKTRESIVKAMRAHAFHDKYHDLLLNIKLSAFTEENLTALEQKRREYHDKLQTIRTQSPADLWSLEI
jgi:DNA topoisomerase-2